jgi:hypothetical protein
MPRKIKIPIQAMEDMEGGAISRPMEGGRVCCICKEHLDKMEKEDEMEGGGYLSKAAEKVEKVSRKGASKVKKAGKATGKYITSTEADNGLASDLITYGIPATTAALLGTPAGMVGGPVAGVAASALGSKLGALAGEEIKKEALKEGGAIKPKRKAKFEKGSDDAKEYMRKLREMRGKK